MIPSAINPGHTYRTRAGGYDLFVEMISGGMVHYRVENGDLVGTRAKVEIADFAGRVRALVPNYITPGTRLLSPEES